MKQRKTYAEQLQNAAYGIIRVVGVCIFLVLTVFCMTHSQYMQPKEYEFPINKPDIPGYNLLAAAAAVLLLLSLQKIETKISPRAQKWLECSCLAISMLWVGGWGFWWINSVDRIPTGDQSFLYGAASYFLEGDYSFLGPRGYFEVYPHQLGLVALIEFLFLFTGTYQYFAFEVICVILSAGIVLLGYLLLRELNASGGARIFYLLLIMNCIPLICYTSWVYGDIPSIFFTLLAACLIVGYHNRRDSSGEYQNSVPDFSNRPRSRHNGLYLAGMVFASTMAVLVRKNSMVFLAALSLLAICYFVRYRRWQVLTAVVLSLLLPYLCYQGIYKAYEVRSGYEHSNGLPINAWINMGLQDENGICGWYNNMPIEVLASLSYDYDATEKVMAEGIRERLSVFQKDPKYAVTFVAKKVISQWNAPLYQSIYFSSHYNGISRPKTGSYLDGIYGFRDEFFQVFSVADRMQFILYLGVLFYFLFAVRRETQPFAHLLAVTVIGGFFFSILWEAKARYIFTYYVTMYPLAAIGYSRMIAVCRAMFRKENNLF